MNTEMKDAIFGGMNAKSAEECSVFVDGCTEEFDGFERLVLLANKEFGGIPSSVLEIAVQAFAAAVLYKYKESPKILAQSLFQKAGKIGETE